MKAAKRQSGKAARNDVQVSATVRVPASARVVRELVLGVLAGEKQRGASVSITFVGPARMRTLNREHLGHDYVTDVISFALGDRTALVGDIYVCPAVAVKAAREFGTTAKNEIQRLVVHGVLHVLGYTHPETGDRTRSAMWIRQERHLKASGA